MISKSKLKGPELGAGMELRRLELYGNIVIVKRDLRKHRYCT